MIETEPFWSAHQPGIRFTDERPGTPEFFAAVERQRYELEPHIHEVVGFADWLDRDVLEVGCGIGTDGVNFARAGARYVATDQSAVALRLAECRFQQEGLDGDFVQSQTERLPFPDESFDLVYSHGVIHHIANPEDAVRELGRVLRPNGTALVMVYHRNSFNYWVTILGVRRVLAGLLLVPGLSSVVAWLTGERKAIVEGHRELLARYGWRYLSSARLFLCNNTDGPGNPLSVVYTREQVADLFFGFEELRFVARNLNLRLYPWGQRIAQSRLGKRLGSRWGWHLYVRAVKPQTSTATGAKR